MRFTREQLRAFGVAGGDPPTAIQVAIRNAEQRAGVAPESPGVAPSNTDTRQAVPGPAAPLVAPAAPAAGNQSEAVPAASDPVADPGRWIQAVPNSVVFGVAVVVAAVVVFAVVRK